VVPNATYAIRLGAIAAGISLVVLLFAPGSRADEANSFGNRAAEPTSTGNDLPIAVPTTLAAPTTLPPSTIAATTVATTRAGATTAPAATVKVASSASARVPFVLDIVGVRIDRGTTWIAIATVWIVDQTNAPAAGVDVHTSWSFGPTLASCRTDSAGKCSMYQSALPANLDTTTITILAPFSGAKTISRPGLN
jgi:hypothetical protein